MFIKTHKRLTARGRFWSRYFLIQILILIVYLLLK